MRMQWSKARTGIRAIATVLASMYIGVAQAQDAGPPADYRLPPPPETPAPSPQGPVTPEHPVVFPASPPPAPKPAPAPSSGETRGEQRSVIPAPRVQDEALQRTRQNQTGGGEEVDRPAPRTSTPPPSPSQPSPFQPSTDDRVSPETQGNEDVSVPPVRDSSSSDAALSSQTGQPSETSPPNEPVTGKILGLLSMVLLLLGGTVFYLRTRRRKESSREAVDAESSASPTPQPAKAAPIPAAPGAVPAIAQEGVSIELRLIPEKLLLSLVYVTLIYKLVLVNKGSNSVGPLRVSADITSAHASRPNKEQLSFDPSRAKIAHDGDMLPSGQSVTFSGDLRLPLSEIQFLTRNQRAMFVPLVQFLIETGLGAHETRVFALGLAHNRPGAGMDPIPMEPGPRLIEDFKCREVDVSKWLA